MIGPYEIVSTMGPREDVDAHQRGNRQIEPGLEILRTPLRQSSIVVVDLRPVVNAASERSMLLHDLHAAFAGRPDKAGAQDIVAHNSRLPSAGQRCDVHARP